MISAQDKLWEAVGAAAEGPDSIALLRQALAEGATLDCRDYNGNDPLAATVDVCCPGKDLFARELAMLGCNPLDGALIQAIVEEDLPISQALVEASIARGYRDMAGRGVLEVVLSSAAFVNMLPDLLRSAFASGIEIAPANKDWFSVLLDNHRAREQSLMPQVAPFAHQEASVFWDVCGVLLDQGLTPTQETLDAMASRMGSAIPSVPGASIFAHLEQAVLDRSTQTPPFTRPGPRL